jgi:hypothetical protein
MDIALQNKGAQDAYVSCKSTKSTCSTEPKFEWNAWDIPYLVGPYQVSYQRLKTTENQNSKWIQQFTLDRLDGIDGRVIW